MLCNSSTGGLFAWLVTAAIALAPTLSLSLAAPPAAPVEPIVLPPTSSTFSVPIRMKVADLQAIANAKIPKTMEERKAVTVSGFRNESVWFRLERQDVAISVRGDVIAFSIPFAGNGGFDGIFHPLPFAGGIGIHKGATFAGKVEGTIKLTLNANWTVSSQETFHASFEQAEADFNLVRGIHFKVSFRGRAEEAINAQAPGILKAAVDQAIAQFNVRGQMEKAWSGLHMRQQLSDSPASWLTVVPQEIHVSPLRSADGVEMTAAVAVTARTAVTIAPTAPEIAAGKLPNAVIDSKIGDAIDVVLPVRVSPDELAAELKKAIEGKTFTSKDGKTVTVKSADVTIEGNRLVVRSTLISHEPTLGDISCALTIKAAVALSHDKTLLQLSNLESDVKASNIAVALWTNLRVKTQVLPEIERRARVQVKPLLAKAIAEANNALAHFKSPAGTRLDVGVTAIELNDVHVAGGGLFFLFHGTGHSALTLKP